jgi:glycosyltransferase involved in cell wall biosynthesis
MAVNTVKVSVVIPAYNVQEYIIECLNSVIQQTLREIEILVVNDGSSDKTQELIAKFIDQKNDNRLILINQQNQGLSAARNSGAKKAIGEYLFFLDGDDWLQPNALERMYGEAVRNHAELVICDYLKRYSTKTEVHTGGSIPYLFKANTDNIIRAFLTRQIVIAAWNKLYKTEWYRQHGFQFPVGYLFEDIPLTNLICTATAIVKINEPLYNYRQRDGSIMKTLSRSILKKIDLVDNIANLLKEKGIFDSLYKEYQSFYIDVILLQLVNGCLQNNIQNKELSQGMVKEILNWPQTKKYLKKVLSNPYLSNKYKFAALLLKYSPPAYKLMFKIMQT